MNNYVDIAAEVGADGVHVGQGDLLSLGIRVIRERLGPGKIIGVSCKTVEEALKAQEEGADYIGVGAVYSTTTKNSAVVGVGRIIAIHDVVKLPIVAIGGITLENASLVLPYCSTVALISGLYSGDFTANVLAFQRLYSSLKG